MAIRTLLITAWLVAALGFGVAQWLRYGRLVDELEKCEVDAGVRPERELEVGLELPEIETLDMDARPLKVAARGGGPSLLFIYEPACPVCEEALPRWIELHDRLRLAGSEVPVVGLSTVDSYATARNYRDHGIPFPVAVFPDAETRHRYGVIEVPRTVVVGADGRVEALWTQPLRPSDVADVLKNVCPDCAA